MLFMIQNGMRDLPTMVPIKFPVFEVITPVAGYGVSVRGMTVAQESVVRESSTTSAKMDSITNQIIFECIENKVPPYDTLEGFEKSFSVIDKIALCYGILVTSYGDTQKFMLQCPNCGKSHEAEVVLSNHVKITNYDGDDNLLQKEITVELPVSGYKAVIKIPTLFDRRVLNLTKGVTDEVISKMEKYLIVKRLIIPGTEIAPDGSTITKEYTVDKLMEIYSTMSNLPTLDNKVIFDAWNDNFDKYGIVVEIPEVCPSCGYDYNASVSIMMELFRNIRKYQQ